MVDYNDNVNDSRSYQWQKYTTTGIPFNPSYCQYRLPCGFCERLGRECLKPVTQPYTVTLSNSQ